VLGVTIALAAGGLSVRKLDRLVELGNIEAIKSLVIARSWYRLPLILGYATSNLA